MLIVCPLNSLVKSQPEITESVFYFTCTEQNETEYNRIQQRITSNLRKHQKIKAKNTRKTNLKRRNRIFFSPPDEIIQRSERKMKVVHQKDNKNKAISMG